MDISDYILYNDEHFVVINKPPLMPSQPDPTGDLSVLEWAEKHFSKPLYVIHRLDRVASGAIVLAKTEPIASDVSKQFKNRNTKKTYWAIVEKRPEQETATLVHFLKKNAKTNTSKVFSEPKEDAKQAELYYILRGASDRYFLLEVELLTGRHHQIRVQLSAIGCPIKGDVKYGARRSNADRAIHLHAHTLEFYHPATRKLMSFQAPLPNDKLWQFFETMQTGKIN